MNKKLIAAAALLLALSLMLCACSRDASYIAELDGKRIPNSDNSLKMFTAFSTAKGKTGETASDAEVILAHDIDGVPAEKWIEDETLRLLREQLAVDAEFDRLELTLPDEASAKADSNAEKQWERYSDVYNKNGVTEDSVRESCRSSLKPKYIFEALYGADGERALTTDEIAAFFDADYKLFRIIGIAKRDEDGEKLGEKELEEQRERAVDYMDRIRAGENADALVAQAEEELCELAGSELDHEHGSELQSHISIVENGELLYSVDIMEFIEQMSPGEVALYEDDEDYYFVLQKLSAADSEELIENNRLAVSYELRLDEFNEYLDSLTDAVELELNGYAVECYRPELFVLD